MREPAEPAAVGTPVSTSGIASETGVGFSAAGGAAASSTGVALRPDAPAISPRKNATQSASRRPAKMPTACRAVSEIW